MNEIVREDIEDIVAGFQGWERFHNKVVLITGASGFLPAYMVEVLHHLSTSRKANVHIIAQVRNRQRASSRFAHLLGSTFLEIVEQDVCSPYLPEGKIDFIVHAASQASPKFYGSDPVGTLNANVLGTNNLLEIARNKQVEKFLYFSSSEVYGQLPPEKIPTSESDYGYLDPTNVRACYAEGKRMGETMCVSWSHQYNVPVSIVRPFHTYGPGMDLNDGRVYADFISDIVHGRDIIMKSDGSAIRAFCYISDATKAFFTVLLNGKNAEAYNVGNDGGQCSIIDLAQQLILLFPEKGLKVVKQSQSEGPYINSLVSRIAPGIDKLKLLGWIPETSIENGFLRTIRSYL
jgi:UDP-glucuronate decarboxylase